MKPKPPTLLLADKKELSATLPPPSKPIGFGMDGEFKRPMTSGLNPVKSAKKNSILPPPPTSLLNDSGVNNDLNVTYVVGANEKLGSSLKRFLLSAISHSRFDLRKLRIFIDFAKSV